MLIAVLNRSAPQPALRNLIPRSGRVCQKISHSGHLDCAVVRTLACLQPIGRAWCSSAAVRRISESSIATRCPAIDDASQVNREGRCEHVPEQLLPRPETSVGIWGFTGNGLAQKDEWHCKRKRKTGCALGDGRRDSEMAEGIGIQYSSRVVSPANVHRDAENIALEGLSNAANFPTPQQSYENPQNLFVTPLRGHDTMDDRPPQGLSGGASATQGSGTVCRARICLPRVVFVARSSRTFSIMVATEQRKAKLTNQLPPELHRLVSPYCHGGDIENKEQHVNDFTREKGNMEFHAADYLFLRSLVTSAFEVEYFEGIPDFVLRAFDAFAGFAYPAHQNQNKQRENSFASAPSNHREVSASMCESLSQSLKPFQVAGVRFGLERNGRCLIGDEMGLGKTLQALGIAAVYRDDWPCLIISPSSVQYQWKDEIRRWLPDVRDSEVIVVRSSRGIIPATAKMVIASYDLVRATQGLQKEFQFVICDESHYLRSPLAQRTKVILPMLQRARRCVLLSGTPALNNPPELYQQLNALMPGFASPEAFCQRYAEMRWLPWTEEDGYTGGFLTEELNLFLKSTVMVRRLKRDVQKELPSKMRTKIPLSCPPVDLEELQIVKSQVEGLQKARRERLSGDDKRPRNAIEGANKALIGKGVTALFRMTGFAKRAVARDYMVQLLSQKGKIIVFAHHRAVLNALENQAKESKVDYVRIDGSSTSQRRQILVDKFQMEKNCRVAILSITACGQGLNLTAAGTVVFAELYWVPGVMIQAEDRCHRIGTEHTTIDIHYLIAKDTLDEVLWKLIDRKWHVMTSTLNGESEHLQVASEGARDSILHEFGLPSHLDEDESHLRADSTLGVYSEDSEKQVDTKIALSPLAISKKANGSKGDTKGFEKKALECRGGARSLDSIHELLTLTREMKEGFFSESYEGDGDRFDIHSVGFANESNTC